MTRPEQLKPCPFCGSTATLDDDRLLWVVRCTGCGTCVLGERAEEPGRELPASYWEPFRQSAIDRWNRRTALAQPEPVGNRVAELEAELERERLRLAACGVVAMADTPEAAAKARDMPLDYHSASLDEVIRQVDALMELRSKLVQPEPAGPSLLRTERRVGPWGEWSALIAQPVPAPDQPEPVGPTDEELERRFRVWWHDEGSGMPPLKGMDHEEHVRRISQIAWHNGAYVARLGRPAITPIPVSERLPGAEDCDAEGRLYAVYNGRWFQIDLSCLVEGGFSHWLPAHALPLPPTT